MAMEFLRDGTHSAPELPWFCYLSFGASGAPQAAPPEWADRYRGRFDLGYDRYREVVLGNMKRLGMVPMAPRSPRPTGIAGAAARPTGA